jgi:hypothetical protein
LLERHKSEPPPKSTSADETTSSGRGAKLRLAYETNNINPQIITKENVAAFYSMQITEQPANQPKFTTLFIAYDFPIGMDTKIKISFLGERRPYEVKTFEPRQTVIVFEGTLGGTTVDITVQKE